MNKNFETKQFRKSIQKQRTSKLFKKLQKHQNDYEYTLLKLLNKEVDNLLFRYVCSKIHLHNEIDESIDIEQHLTNKSCWNLEEVKTLRILRKYKTNQRKNRERNIRNLKRFFVCLDSLQRPDEKLMNEVKKIFRLNKIYMNWDVFDIGINYLPEYKPTDREQYLDEVVNV